MNIKWIQTVSLGSALLAVSVVSASDIQVTVDGIPVKFGLAKPLSSQGRILVPLRGVFEHLGAYVQWNPATRTIDAQKDTTQVKLIIGNNYATVNGTEVKLDTPPQIVNGGTMVPLRFLSESLGANVNWKAEERLVAISTNGDPSDQNINSRDPENPRNPNHNQDGTPKVERVIDAFTVIPVTLRSDLSSIRNRKGDTFSATVDTKGQDDYAGIPEGSRLQGVVVQAKPQEGKDPGTLELAFDTLILPNGKKFHIDGTTYSLDSKELEKNDDGILIAKNKQQNNRAAYAGYGAGAGILVGLLDNGKLDLGKALIGGLLGLAVGSDEKGKQNPTDVKLEKGSVMGVRLNESVAIRL